MQLTIEKLRTDTLMLACCLLAGDPQAIDYGIRFSDAQNQRAIWKRLFIDYLFFKINRGEKWIRILDSDREYYVQIISKDDVFFSGRYFRSLPHNARHKKILTIKVSNKTNSASAMLTELQNLVKSLALGINVKIAGTGERILLHESTNRGGKLKILIDILHNTEQAISANYNKEIILNKASTMRKILQTLNISKIRNHLIETEEEIISMHNSFKADALLSGWFIMWCNVCLEVENFYQETKNNQIATLEFNRFVGFGSAGIESDPRQLIGLLINKLIKEGLEIIPTKLANQYRKDGEILLSNALDGNSLEVWGKNLYLANLYFFMAYSIYLILSESSPVSAKSVEFYKKALNVTEEKYVRINCALFNAVKNRTGEQLELHQGIIKTIHEKHGADKSRDKAFEYINMKYFYPRFYKSILLES